jgi:hypothetical protein
MKGKEGITVSSFPHTGYTGYTGLVEPGDEEHKNAVNPMQGGGKNT